MQQTSITKEEFHLIRDYIEKECGIALNEEKMYLVESRLASLIAENGCTSFTDFYLKVKTSANEQLKTKIINAITTNETLWFRDEKPFAVLKEKLFPEFSAKLERGEKNQVRIWSAASSTGQEPYSIAMVAHEFSTKERRGRELVNGKLSILATDISSAALQIAQNARYNPIVMSRGISDDLKQRYFEQQGPVWVLKNEIKQMVRFQQFNLQHPFSAFGKFDIIMLRNVAIYFSCDFKKELFKKVAQALNPGGYLFLGTSEALVGYSNDFVSIGHNNYTYYQLKG